MSDAEPARTGVSIPGGQTGDVAIRDTAGGHIIHSQQGMTGEQLGRILEQQSEFYMVLVSAYERQYKEVQAALAHLRDEHDMYRAGEANARRVRQDALDRRLGLIAAVLIALSALVLYYVANATWM